MLLNPILAYIEHRKIYKKSNNNIKLKISGSIWSEKFELPTGSYSASDIQFFLSISLKNMKQWLIILQ